MFPWQLGERAWENPGVMNRGLWWPGCKVSEREFTIQQNLFEFWGVLTSFFCSFIFPFVFNPYSQLFLGPGFVHIILTHPHFPAYSVPGFLLTQLVYICLWHYIYSTAFWSQLVLPGASRYPLVHTPGKAVTHHSPTLILWEVLHLSFDPCLVPELRLWQIPHIHKKHTNSTGLVKMKPEHWFIET